MTPFAAVELSTWETSVSARAPGLRPEISRSDKPDYVADDRRRLRRSGISVSARATILGNRFDGAQVLRVRRRHQMHSAELRTPKRCGSVADSAPNLERLQVDAENSEARKFLAYLSEHAMPHRMVYLPADELRKSFCFIKR